MAGIKNKKVCALLKKWLQNSNVTQNILAERYKVTQPVISKQLSGQESIPEERIQDIIDITNPPQSDISLMNEILSHEDQPVMTLRDKTSTSRALINAYGEDLMLEVLLWHWKDVTNDDIKKYILPLIVEIRERLKKRGVMKNARDPELEGEFLEMLMSYEKRRVFNYDADSDQDDAKK